MRISFDLDDVLFVSPDLYETEPPLRFPLNKLFPERLRKGTVDLVHELQRQGFEVWVYTSSFRTEGYIKALFRQYGARFDGIINGDIHNKIVQRDRKVRLPQKMPQYFHISLHVDDEEAIIKSGRDHGFKVLKVYEPDPDWDKKVIAEANRVRNLEERVARRDAPPV